MPRIARKRPNERQIVITLTFTGSLFDAYDAARHVLDSGVLQDAMHDHAGDDDKRPAFVITNAEVK